MFLNFFFQMFSFDLPENIRKTKGDQKGALGRGRLISVTLLFHT